MFSNYSNGGDEIPLLFTFLFLACFHVLFLFFVLPPPEERNMTHETYDPALPAKHVTRRERPYRYFHLQIYILFKETA
jgi:hypothetical protein